MIHDVNPEDMIVSAGLRPTQARKAIMVYLAQSGKHPTTDELGRALRENGHEIPTATLYQSLEKLTQAKLLARFSGPDGQVRYDANLSVHHHLICTSCQEVRDIIIDTPLSDLRVTDEKNQNPVTGWTLENAFLELKGLCPECSLG